MFDTHFKTDNPTTEPLLAPTFSLLRIAESAVEGGARSTLARPRAGSRDLLFAAEPRPAAASDYWSETLPRAPLRQLKRAFPIAMRAAFASAAGQCTLRPGRAKAVGNLSEDN